jgi:hypothetical protein
MKERSWSVCLCSYLNGVLGCIHSNFNDFAVVWMVERVDGVEFLKALSAFYD